MVSVARTNWVIIILRTKSIQTKSQITQELKSIGRDITLWMYGGNFPKYLIKKGLVEPVGKSGDEDLFSLTTKGIIKVDSCLMKSSKLAKYNLKNYL